MAGKVLNIKVCSPLKLRSGLTGNYHAICHYSYNLPLATRRKKRRTIMTDSANLEEFILFFSPPTKRKKETPTHIAAHFQAPTSQRPNQRLVKELQFCLRTGA